MDTRRSFFQELTLLSALAASISGESEAQPAAKQTQEFWDAYFDEAESTDNRRSRGDERPAVLDEKKVVNFLQSTDNGLRYSTDIAPTELLEPPPPEKDVVVTVNPGHFRPSTEDHARIQKTRGSHVRVDWFQKQPLMNLVAPMAWAGLAAWSPTRIDPKTKKTIAAPIPPSLTDLSFRDPNAPDAPAHNEVILMGGSGRMAVNVTAVRVNAKVDAALKATVDYSSIVAPYFGFAPLAVPALRAFTQLIGYLYHREYVLMNALPVEIVATRGAKAAPGPVNRINMVSGGYLAVPDDHAGKLKDSMSQLRLDSGWLVHKDADKSQNPAARGLDPRVPDITYLSMDVKVEPLGDVVQRKAAGG